MYSSSLNLLKKGHLYDLWHNYKDDSFWHNFLLSTLFKDNSKLKHFSILSIDSKSIFLYGLFNLYENNKKNTIKSINLLKKSNNSFYFDYLNFLDKLKSRDLKAIKKNLLKNNNYLFLAVILINEQYIYSIRNELLTIIDNIKTSDISELLKIKILSMNGDYDEALNLSKLLFNKLDKNEYLYNYLIRNTIIVYAKQNRNKEMVDLLEHLVSLQLCDIDTIRIWLSISISNKDLLSSFEKRIMRAELLFNEYTNNKYLIYIFYMIYLWVDNQFDKCAVVSETSILDDNCKPFDKLKDKNTKVFNYYISFLGKFRKENLDLYNQNYTQTINVIGESHSLSPSNLTTKLFGKNSYYKTNFVMGIKMWHLADKAVNIHKINFISYLSKIPKNTVLLLTIGEIDCRATEGIWSVCKKKNLDLEEVVLKTIVGYIEYIASKVSVYQIKTVIIQGIPATNMKLDKIENKDRKLFLNMFKLVNKTLEKFTLKQGWNFLDIYSATVAENGQSNKKWHIDTNHIKPSFYQEADKWLIKGVSRHLKTP